MFQARKPSDPQISRRLRLWAALSGIVVFAATTAGAADASARPEAIFLPRNRLICFTDLSMRSFRLAFRMLPRTSMGTSSAHNRNQFQSEREELL